MKRPRTSRLLLSGLALVAGSALLAGCSSNAATQAADDTASGSIVLVHDQPAGDGAVIDAQIAGTKSVAEQLGFSEQEVYIADPANYASTLKNVADGGATVIVASFPRITDAFNEVAAEYPDIKFVHVYSDPADPKIDNLLTVSYNYYETMYLSGVLAASASQTGKVAWIGGDTQTQMAADYNAFVAGAKSVDPSIEVTQGIVGDFADANKAQTIANQLYESGVDVIQADAGGADSGVVAAAGQAPGRLVIGENPSVSDTAPDAALGYVGLDFGASVIESVDTVLADGFSGGDSVTGIGDSLFLEVVATAPANAGAASFAAAQAAVEKAKADLQSGTTKVPFVGTMP